MDPDAVRRPDHTKKKWLLRLTPILSSEQPFHTSAELACNSQQDLRPHLNFPVLLIPNHTIKVSASQEPRVHVCFGSRTPGAGFCATPVAHLKCCQSRRATVATDLTSRWIPLDPSPFANPCHRCHRQFFASMQLCGEEKENMRLLSPTEGSMARCAIKLSTWDLLYDGRGTAGGIWSPPSCKRPLQSSAGFRRFEKCSVLHGNSSNCALSSVGSTAPAERTPCFKHSIAPCPAMSSATISLLRRALRRQFRFQGLPFPFGVASSIAASCRSGNAACRAGQVRGWAQASSCTELTAGDCLQDYSLLHRNYSIIRVRSKGARK